MPAVKGVDVAGSFYPSDPREILKAIAAFEESMPLEYACQSRAVIVPHAGWAYSGCLAANTLQYLDAGAKNIFIFAPAHRTSFEGIAVGDYDGFETPLGTLATNGDICAELVGACGCRVFNGAFACEHAIEVQLPLLHGRFANAKIIPLVVGDATPRRVEDIIEKFWSEENAFVISSDLSHFHSSEEAEKIDGETSAMIEDCAAENFSNERACGATSICGLIGFAARKNFAPIRVGTRNSRDATCERKSVVGYGAWMLAEKTKNRFIADNFAELTTAICRGAIEEKFDSKDSVSPAVPEVLKQHGASFVTLEIGDELRGCIGSIHAHRRLVDDLVSNAKGAAFRDSRFSPLTAEEFKKVTVKISLLSPMRRIAFCGERDLLDNIVPKVDGIVIRDGPFQAIYLPSVWQQLPDPEQFLASLKVKAGLSAAHFSSTFEAFKFSSECIQASR
ncbi:MAG: AmmeMemoRadiSam system protein B [Puniceicoccales bacterium]|jgi:AmmeMemoRadiSam system protein B/AmmeMemoRadiSam system protein A|nr:AmmeMemoRadiSam system protein B [Puniceicoccales bacterium]